MPPSAAATPRAWVDLPQPSIPSSAIRRPRGRRIDRVDRWRLASAGGDRRFGGCDSRTAFLAVAFLAGAFLAVVFLAVVFLAGTFLAGRLLGAGLASARRGPGGPALGQQLGGPLDVDRLDVVALAQGGVGGPVGHVGAEPAVLDHHGQIRWRGRSPARAAGRRPPGPGAAWAGRTAPGPRPA